MQKIRAIEAKTFQSLALNPETKILILTKSIERITLKNKTKQ